MISYGLAHEMQDLGWLDEMHGKDEPIMFYHKACTRTSNMSGTELGMPIRLRMGPPSLED